MIGVPDDVWGEAVMAYVVPRRGRAGPRSGRADLIAHVRAVKGSAWAPKVIEFVPALPLTGLGKPDKKAASGAATALERPETGRALTVRSHSKRESEYLHG